MNDDPLDMLDDLFAQARDQRIMPSAALTQRVLADAANQPLRRPAAPFWAQIGQMIGGWPALGGLAAASVAGIWLGAAPPAPLADYADVLLGGGGTVSIGLFDAGVDFETGELSDG